MKNKLHWQQESIDTVPHPIYCGTHKNAKGATMLDSLNCKN